MNFNARRFHRGLASRDGSTRCRDLVLPPQSVSVDRLAAAKSSQQEDDEKKSVPALALLLQRCGSSRSLAEGRKIHAQIAASGLDKNLFLANHLVHMYGKCGSMDDAAMVFQAMDSPNVFSWSIFIGACVENGLAKRALQLYHRMDQEGVKLDMVVLINVVSACSSLGMLEEGRSLRARIASMGFQLNPVVRNSLLNMFCKAGSFDEAELFFQEMNDDRSVVSWTAMISGFAMHGREDMSILFFRKMVAEGVRANEVTFVSVLGACSSISDLEHGRAIHDFVEETEFRVYLSVATALIDMYGKCGRPEVAWSVFEKLGEKDLVVWNAMIAVSSQHPGREEASLDLFRLMDLEGETPDDITFIALLEACSNLRALATGKSLHELIVDCALASMPVVRNSLLNMYGKCGSLDDARNVFESCAKSRDLITWSTMIAAYTVNGDGKEALFLCQQMDLEGVKPDEYTFTSLLDACSIAGALAEGRVLHKRLQAKGLEKKMVTGTALINMYGRCGRPEDALIVFENMARRSLVSWTALIAAFAQHGDVQAMEISREMDLEGVLADDVVFLSLLHGCSHAGLLKVGLSCFTSMISDYGVEAGATQYSCMVDLLARCGRVAEAEELLHSMPYEPAHMEIKTLLSACRVSGDPSRGARVARFASRLMPQDAAPYVLMSHTFAAAEKWDEVAEVYDAMVKLGVKKPKGWSSIQVKNRLYQFFSGDFRWHPQAAEIGAELQRLQEIVRDAGYVPDTKQVAHRVDEEHKEDLVAVHSEKVAIAFGLLRIPAGLPIHVVKNLRVCADCHAVTKIVSTATRRKIVVRDAFRFHRFENGVCSCGDYW